MWEYHNSSQPRKNVLIMICNSGCHRSVANAESWSNFSTRYGRLLHSASPLHPSELDFRKDTHTECSPLVPTSDSMTEYWKQLRRESFGRKHEESKSLRSTRIITKLAELNAKQDIFSELVERLRNFRETTNALADRLHTGDTTSQPDPNVVGCQTSVPHNDEKRVMIWNACRHSPVTHGTNDDVFPTGHRRGNRALDPRHRVQNLVLQQGRMVEKPCSRPETTNEVFRVLSETIIPSREQLEQVAGVDFRKQLESTVPLYSPGEWKYEFKLSKLTT